jgi:hypothetical protein
VAGPWERYAAPAGAVEIAGPDPFKVEDQQMQRRGQELQEANAARAARDQAIAEDKARRETLEWNAKHNPDGTVKPDAIKDPKVTEGERASAGYFLRALNAHQRYGAGVEPRGAFAQGAIDLLPDSIEHQYFNDPERRAANNFADEFIRAKLRKESGAAIPTDEMAREYQVYFPVPGDAPEDLARKAQLREEAIEALRIGAGSEADSAAARLQSPGRTAFEQSTTAPSEQVALATAGTKTEDDPALAGVRGEYLRMLGDGSGPREIVDRMKELGVTMDREVMRSIRDQVMFRRANPQTPLEQYDTGVLDDRIVPTSAFEGAMTNAAGTDAGVLAIRAGNAVTANTLDNIVGASGGNAERARLAIEDAGRRSPTAALIGDVAGTVTGALGAEAGLARASMGAGFGRALAADTLTGAASGAGAADDGSRLGGAVTGGALGLAGSVGGQALARGGAKIVAPTGGNARGLYDAGVRPTPGQRFVNANEGKGIAGMAGRALNATEEALSSVPVVGSAIRGARQEARDQWQLGAFNESLKEIGQKLPPNIGPGGDPHIFAEAAFDRVYDRARAGMRLRVDDQLLTDVEQVGRTASTLTDESRRRFEKIVAEKVVRRASGGDEASGKVLKTIQSDLKAQIRDIRKSKAGDDELADALEELSHAIDQGARRHSSPRAVALMDKADRGYAKLVRIEQASGYRGGEAGTFTANQLDRAVQANSRGVRSREYLRGEAMLQDYAKQGANLTDRLPNSGSADRGMMGAGALGGIYAIDPTSAAVTAGAGLLYAPGVRKVVSGAMAPRQNARAIAIAQKMMERSRLAGALGAALLIPSTGGQ